MFEGKHQFMLVRTLIYLSQTQNTYIQKRIVISKIKWNGKNQKNNNKESSIQNKNNPHLFFF